MVYFLIFISAIFVNNIVLSQFLGICPFLGVSKKIDTAMGMSAAVVFVLTLATVVTYLLQMLLVAWGLEFLQTILFILIIAALVQMIEIILKKISPALYQALGVFLPLITTNCCILGVAILVANGCRTRHADRNALCVCYRPRLRSGAHPVRRYPRATRTGKSAGGNERHAYRASHRRSARHGFHGIQRSGIITRIF